MSGLNLQYKLFYTAEMDKYIEQLQESMNKKNDANKGVGVPLSSARPKLLAA